MLPAAAGVQAPLPFGASPQPVWKVIMQDHIAHLKRRCVEGLGEGVFQVAEEYLRSSACEDPSVLHQRMVDILGHERLSFASMVNQIVHMERKWKVRVNQISPDAR